MSDDVGDLHRQAMDLAEQGQFRLREGDSHGASKAFRQAADLERRAAEATPPDLEPDRSVLFRSAASLALDCG
ncbi:MAG: hypothetical protein OER90_16290, partial [Gemmatimonadota bacterium]|nr:hypothetical protein [Gemmatimonadota bacterium]